MTSISNYKIKKGQVTLHLYEKLVEFENYISDPFIIFEKQNFLDEDSYNKMVDELYNFNYFDYQFVGQGEKKKSSITGSDLYALDEGVFKDFCRTVISNDFYRWFKSTHLPFFYPTHAFYITHPKSILYKVVKRIRNFFRIPVSFYHTEIELSSINQGSFIPPHTDQSNKRLSFVFYIPSNQKELTDAMKTNLGTTFWGAKESCDQPLKRFNCKLLDQDEELLFLRDYEEKYVAKYEKNKIAGFIKSNISWHTVNKNKFDYDRRAIVINIYEV